LKIRSPISGHVINKYVREGQYVQEGMPLYDVADLSTVWIQAQIYEDDIPFLPATRDGGPVDADGVEVIATTRAFPNEEFHGKLTFIYPHVDEETRTVTVRFELANKDHKLRPGSTATVTLKVKPLDLPLFGAGGESERKSAIKDGQILAVPDGSIIDTGKQKIAYREASPGVYEGVDVKVGPRMLGKDGAAYYPVLAGLKPGDLVVTSGSFLVDAETRLNPALGSVYFGGSGASQSKATKVSTVRPSTPENPEATIKAGWAQLTLGDRKLAQAQGTCPITKNRLGSMGPPVKVLIDGQIVFLCCPACKEKALANSKQTLATVADLKQQPPQGGAKETSTLPKETGKQYDIVGKVTAVDSNKKTVTIDHEAIEGLMSAMEMPYKLDNSQVLKGIKPGDQIRGRLEVRGPDYVITELHKR
jgi:Cu/Ag efflux protein CusF